MSGNPIIKAGSVWRSCKRDRSVRVLNLPTLDRVRYEDVLTGQLRSSFVDSFLAAYTPVKRVKLRDVLLRMSKSARSGEPLVMAPHELRVVIAAARDPWLPKEKLTHAE